MKIEEIQPGKKYTQTKTGDERVGGHGTPRVRHTSIVRVLEVSPDKTKVLASYNGAAAQWVGYGKVRYWEPFQTVKA